MVPTDLRERLTRYYDEEARRGLRRGKGPLRERLRARFTAIVLAEGRSTLLDVGAGPGHDAGAFAAAGLRVVGLDLAPVNASLIATSAVPAVVGSVEALPFPSASFDAVWTMSTLVHVPDADLDAALESIVTAARPGGPVGIGTWGGFDFEGISDHTGIEPPRFFALRGHARMLAALQRHGTVECWETHHPDPSNDWWYQFAIVRSPAGSDLGIPVDSGHPR